MATLEELIPILIQISARQLMSAEELTEKVGASEKLLLAYNLCNGSRTQSEIVKAAKVDQAQFSRASARWVQEGIAFRLGEGREGRLLHLYPLPSRSSSKPARRSQAAKGVRPSS